MTDVCRRFLVTGKVQGVFFRASTAREAARLQLAGWARNLPDGRVEVLARGAAPAVQALERWLHKGPPLARVDDVMASEESAAVHAHLVDFRTG
jgi:acylphosphatase